VLAGETSSTTVAAGMSAWVTDAPGNSRARSSPETWVTLGLPSVRRVPVTTKPGTMPRSSVALADALALAVKLLAPMLTTVVPGAKAGWTTAAPTTRSARPAVMLVTSGEPVVMVPLTAASGLMSMAPVALAELSTCLA
jgi:hypothetical protein